MAVAGDRARIGRAHARALGHRLSLHGRRRMSAEHKTPLARVRGLGSAKAGTEHFWRQRLTAVANVPLTIAFVLIVVSLLGAAHATAQRVLGTPLVAIIVLLFIGSVTYHMR